MPKKRGASMSAKLTEQQLREAAKRADKKNDYWTGLSILGTIAMIIIIGLASSIVVGWWSILVIIYGMRCYGYGTVHGADSVRLGLRELGLLDA